MKEMIINLLVLTALVAAAWFGVGLLGIAEGSNDDVTRSVKAAITWAREVK